MTDDDSRCPFCLEPIVTKTRQSTDFTYRCGHKVHTRCATEYLESNALVNTKFQCPLCRAMQSTWFPTRLMHTRAVQCTNWDEGTSWETKTVAAFLECTYVGSFCPSRVGFGPNLEMAKIPDTFDASKCKKQMSLALFGILGGKDMTGGKERFNTTVQFCFDAVTVYIKHREADGVIPVPFKYSYSIQEILFGRYIMMNF
jgi:hypothetical protein